MAFDASKNTYTINTISADGTVEVTFDCDGVRQKLADKPVGDKEALLTSLDAYCTAYIAGKTIEQGTAVPNDVKGLVNQKQTVRTDEDTDAAEAQAAKG